MDVIKKKHDYSYMMCMLVEIFLQVLDISTNLLNFPLKVYLKIEKINN